MVCKNVSKKGRECKTKNTQDSIVQQVLVQSKNQPKKKATISVESLGFFGSSTISAGIHYCRASSSVSVKQLDKENPEVNCSIQSPAIANSGWKRIVLYHEFGEHRISFDKTPVESERDGIIDWMILFQTFKDT